MARRRPLLDDLRCLISLMALYSVPRGQEHKILPPSQSKRDYYKNMVEGGTQIPMDESDFAALDKLLADLDLSNLSYDQIIGVWVDLSAAYYQYLVSFTP